MRGRATLRRIARAARLLAGAERPIILMYHRVERLAADPWQLAVTPERFRAQIALLKRRRRVVPMAWLAGEIAAGRQPRRTAAVTFDDGYADVLRNALPALEAEDCPATVFICTGAIGSGREFWWDRLSRIVYETPPGPDALVARVGEVEHRFALPADPAGRDAAHARMHALLKPLMPAVRDEVLARLEAQAGGDPEPRARDLAMTEAELQRLAASPLIEIGAHTVTHPSLPLLSPGAQADEVDRSRAMLERLLGRSVTGFAYPFGDHDAAAVAAVRAAGLAWAVTTEQRAVGRSDGILSLPRVLAADWDDAAFSREVLRHG